MRGVDCLKGSYGRFPFDGELIFIRVDVSGGRDTTKREAEDKNLCPHPCFAIWITEIPIANHPNPC
jgi:hypothetical protein